MSRTSFFSISNLWILSGIIALTALTLWLVFGRMGAAKIDKNERFYQELETLGALLDNRWRKGDAQGHYALAKFTCPELIENRQKIHPSYFQCNPHYLRCFVEGKAGEPAPEGFRLSNFDFDRRGNPVLKFIHAASGKEAHLKFLNTCGAVELAPGVYSAGPLEGNAYLWDNHGQKILIDKRYVTNGEVAIWGQFSGDKELSAIKVGEYHKPSIDLSLEKKKAYCNFRGAQLLQSRYFDAAVFLPGKAKNNYVYKFPYPWTKKKNAISELGEKDCSKIFSKECLEKDYEFHSTFSPSWSGIYHALGSYAESFENKFLASANLKLSSMFLSLASPWHRLGVRSSLEKGADLSDYNGVELEEPIEIMTTEIRSAFRCVEYR